MQFRIRLVVAAVLGVAAAAAGFVGGLYGWRLLTATATVAGEPEAGCDLQWGTCRARFPGGGELTVSVRPRPIPVLKPIAIEIELRAMAADTVEVDLSSPDMYMGYNRRTLRALDAQRFAGQTVLPVCILDRMRWQLRASARRGNTVHEATFEFETVADRSRVSG